MAQNFRHRDILEIAQAEGRVAVEDLAHRFDVTLQTIRRDLAELANAGQLERVHGGAVLPSNTSNIRYEERASINPDGKKRIAAACANDIPNGTSLFLNIGTTTEAVARALLQHRDLLVVTNNLNIANILARNEDCEVIVTGGQLRRTDGGLIGDLAAETIRQFKFDLAVIGCSAIDVDGDMLDFDIQEVRVSQTILERSRSKFALADHTKFMRSAPIRISSLAEIDTVYTDAKLPDEVAKLCDASKTDVRIAG